MKNFKSEYKKVKEDSEYFLKHYFSEVYPIDTRNKETRIADFSNLVVEYWHNGAYELDLSAINRFIEFWTAPGNALQMKFEKQDTFSIPGRLRTWSARQKQFNTIKLTNRLFNGRQKKFPN